MQKLFINISLLIVVLGSAVANAGSIWVSDPKFSISILVNGSNLSAADDDLMKVLLADRLEQKFKDILFPKKEVMLRLPVSKAELENPFAYFAGQPVEKVLNAYYAPGVIMSFLSRVANLNIGKYHVVSSPLVIGNQQLPGTTANKLAVDHHKMVCLNVEINLKNTEEVLPGTKVEDITEWTFDFYGLGNCVIGQ